jgi:hypothetical protein
MTNDPVLFAYAIKQRPRRKPLWLRLGVAFPHDRGAGLTVVLRTVPLKFNGRLILLEPGTSIDGIATPAPPPPKRRRTGRRPDLIAYCVKDTPGTKPAWRRLGAAFAHVRGAGLTVILSLLPLGFDGRIILVESKDHIRNLPEPPTSRPRRGV